MRFILFKNIIKKYISKLLEILSLFIKKKDKLILITADRYNENSKYLFEYLVNKKDFDVRWLTNNINIKKYLDSKSLPCVYGSIKALFYVMRCKIIITSGTKISYLGVSKNTIKYTLWHGAGLKSTEYSNNFANTIKILADINYFDYINFTSEFTSNFIAKTVMKIPVNKIVINGYPRYDQLIEKKNDKEIRNLKLYYISNLKLTKKININTKFIIYTPTWRVNDRKNFFPLLNMKGFEIEKFNKFLSDNNFFLLYTTHPNSIGCNINQSNIFYLNYNKLPLFDLTNFMLVCDILINDYSTTSLDFTLLNKKQITVAFDFNQYLTYDGILEEDAKNLPGNIIFNYSELVHELINDNNIKSNNDLISKFYDLSISDSCNKNYKFLKKLINS